MSLSDEQIRRMALEAAEGIFGASNIDHLDVSAGPDWAGDLSWFLAFTVAQDRDREVALESRLKLRHDIRDRLVAAGDESYPYVRILNRVAATAGG